MEVYNQLKLINKDFNGMESEISIKKTGFEHIEDFHQACMDLAVCQGYHPDLVKQLFDYQTWEEEQRDDEDKTPL